MSSKPNYAGNVRKVMQSLGYDMSRHQIFSDPRRGKQPRQRVKIWGLVVNVEKFSQINNAMRNVFGDKVIGVYNVYCPFPWTIRQSFAVEIAK